MMKTPSIVMIGLAVAILIHPAATADLQPTEFRRALLMNATGTNADDQAIRSLAETLKNKGFVVTYLPDARKNGWPARDAFVRSVPARGASFIYYRGPILAVSDDGQIRYEMVLGGYKKTPSVKRPVQGKRPPAPEPPPNSISRLASQLARNIARQNTAVIDVQGFEDVAKTGKKPSEMARDVASRLRGISQTPNSIGFSAVGAAPDSSAAPAETAFIDRLKPLINGDEGAWKELASVAQVSASKNAVFELKHHVGEVCSPSTELRPGRFAGDQWVDPNGMCFVWCPAATFTMGDAQFEDAQPVEVTISKGFWIGKYELSKGDAELIGLNSGFFSGRHQSQPAHGFNIDHVVEAITGWDEYQKSTQRNHSGWTLDVPTEAEWEYA
ncbi:MAG: hypothetical protein N2C14_19950, partial [Planctomycetales bacterium]